jgi:uncharacterized protein (DUF924 family)
MTDAQRSRAILEFWFGQLDSNGMCAPQQSKLWFQSRPETDAHIEARFGRLVNEALHGRLDHWADRPTDLVALVLLLDQFTRNIHRGTPQAFAGDTQALAFSQNAVQQGTDRGLPAIHRVFLYIPYEHSESLKVQEQGIAQFDQLLMDCTAEARDAVNGFRDYSVAHRDVIARFGRFPHRNDILGRESSAEELEHLQQHGGF